MATEASGLLATIQADWDTFSTVLATSLAIFVVYAFLNSNDPDIHPYLLARQATEAPVRHPGQSAVFRSLDTPHGFPLRTGLNVKDPGAPKWAPGRDGDLRDIWRAAVRGSVAEEDVIKGRRGKIYTVLGKNVTEHSFDEITVDINVIGRYIKEKGAETVGVSLSDSVELLASVFAGAFYNFHVVLIPHKLDSEELSEYLQKSQANLFIGEAGSVDLNIITRNNPHLKHVIWVVKQGSRHMDWNDVPEDVKGTVDVCVWHEVVVDKRDLNDSELITWDPKSPAPSITALWITTKEFIEYKPENLVAGIGALISALPRTQRLTPDDTVLSIDSLSRPYPLSWVLAALYSNSSIALNSVAGAGVDFALATVGVSPTVIIASSRTVGEYLTNFMRPQMGAVSALGRWVQARSLDAGRMATQNFFNRLANVGPTAELSLSKLRLLVISHRVDDAADYLLTSEQLTDLRIFTGARVIYALTAPGVAGAVAQTNPFDYRRHDGYSHFGPPLSSLEIALTGHDEHSGIARVVEGQITVSGPSVVSEKAALPARGRIRHDNTLELLK